MEFRVQAVPRQPGKATASGRGRRPIRKLAEASRESLSTDDLEVDDIGVGQRCGENALESSVGVIHDAVCVISDRVCEAGECRHF